MRKNKLAFFTQKAVASFLSIAIALSTYLEPLTPSFLLAAASELGSAKNLMGDLTAIKLPKEMGRIEEVGRANQKQAVILIQDAHSIANAQNNIQKLIEFFQKEYGVSLIGLEGASGKLDAQIFKSFPNEERLKEIFESYAEQGELAGGNASLLFSKFSGDFFGVEDWDVYEQGIADYLRAFDQQPSLRNEIESFRSSLEEEKKRVYSEQLFQVDSWLQDFRKDQLNLIQVLEHLSGIVPPANGSDLAVLLQESKRQNSQDQSLDSEVRGIASKLQHHLYSLPVSDSIRDDIRLFSQEEQSYKTSAVSANAFAMFLESMSQKYSLQFKSSGKFSEQVQEQKRIRDIQGTRLFEEFKHYAQSIKDSLIQNSQQKALDERSRILDLMERLADLELSYEDWKNVQKLNSRFKEWTLTTDEAPGVDEFAGLFDQMKSHVSFYETAEKRDQFFLNQIQNWMKEKNRDQAMLVAGGFHTEGLIRKLKEKGISYVLVMPEMGNVPKQTAYSAHMHGDVSWKKYFENRSGKINLYEAFVRAARDKLLSGQDAGLLKSWRDQIIRDLQAQNRIAEASNYTRFIDEVKGESSTEWRKQWINNINRFVDGLSRLKSSGTLNTENLLKLSQSITSQPQALGNIFSPNALAQSRFFSGNVSRPELRQDSQANIVDLTAHRPYVPSGKKVVLVIEDNMGEIGRYKRILPVRLGADYDLVIVTTLREALEVIDKVPNDLLKLVITDNQYDKSPESPMQLRSAKSWLSSIGKWFGSSKQDPTQLVSADYRGPSGEILVRSFRDGPLKSRNIPFVMVSNMQSDVMSKADEGKGRFILKPFLEESWLNTDKFNEAARTGDFSFLRSELRGISRRDWILKSLLTSVVGVAASARLQGQEKQPPSVKSYSMTDGEEVQRNQQPYVQEGLFSILNGGKFATSPVQAGQCNVCVIRHGEKIAVAHFAPTERAIDPNRSIDEPGNKRAFTYEDMQEEYAQFENQLKQEGFPMDGRLEVHIFRVGDSSTSFDFPQGNVLFQDALKEFLKPSFKIGKEVDLIKPIDFGEEGRFSGSGGYGLEVAGAKEVETKNGATNSIWKLQLREGAIDGNTLLNFDIDEKGKTQLSLHKGFSLTAEQGALLLGGILAAGSYVLTLSYRAHQLRKQRGAKLSDLEPFMGEIFQNDVARLKQFIKNIFRRSELRSKKFLLSIAVFGGVYWLATRTELGREYISQPIEKLTTDIRMRFNDSLTYMEQKVSQGEAIDELVIRYAFREAQGSEDMMKRFLKAYFESQGYGFHPEKLDRQILLVLSAANAIEGAQLLANTKYYLDAGIISRQELRRTSNDPFLPQAEDFSGLLDAEDVPFHLDVKPGDFAYGLLLKSEAQTLEYLKQIMDGRKIDSRALLNEVTIHGTVYEYPQLERYVASLGAASGQPQFARLLSRAIKTYLKMGPHQDEVVVVKKNISSDHYPRNRVILEEVFHVLEKAKPARVVRSWDEQIVREVVNDLLILMMYRPTRSYKFDSGYTDWSEKEKLALMQRYILEPGRDPNRDLSQVIKQLRQDILSRRELPFGLGSIQKVLMRRAASGISKEKILRGFFGIKDPQKHFRKRLLAYLRVLENTEHFKNHEELFPNWKYQREVIKDERAFIALAKANQEKMDRKIQALKKKYPGIVFLGLEMELTRIREVLFAPLKQDRAEVSRSELRSEPVSLDLNNIPSSRNQLSLQSSPNGTYIMLHKPGNYISSHERNGQIPHVPALSELFIPNGSQPSRLGRAPIRLVGRLDRDTTGLILAGTNHRLNHKLLDPTVHGKGILKTYEAVVYGHFKPAEIEALKIGVRFTAKKKDYMAAAQVFEVIEEFFRNQTEPLSRVRITIGEGKYHQVRKMLSVVGHNVKELKRVRFGEIQLDDSLKPGEWRELSREEYAWLSEVNQRYFLPNEARPELRSHSDPALPEKSFLSYLFKKLGVRVPYQVGDLKDGWGLVPVEIPEVSQQKWGELFFPIEPGMRVFLVYRGQEPIALYGTPVSWNNLHPKLKADLEHQIRQMGRDLSPYHRMNYTYGFSISDTDPMDELNQLPIIGEVLLDHFPGATPVAYSGVFSRQFIHEIGQSIVVFPSVYSPLHGTSLVLRTALEEIKPGERVLIVGVGAGAELLQAAKKGASVVKGIDIGEVEVANAQWNIDQSPYKNVITVSKGDLFESRILEKGEKFDRIILSLPLEEDVRDRKAVGVTTDVNARTFDRSQFFVRKGEGLWLRAVENAKLFLAEGGVVNAVILDGDQDTRNLFREAGFNAHKIFGIADSKAPKRALSVYERQVVEGIKAYAFDLSPQRSELRLDLPSSEIINRWNLERREAPSESTPDIFRLARQSPAAYQDWMMYALMDYDYVIRRGIVELNSFLPNAVMLSPSLLLQHLENPEISITQYGEPTYPEGMRFDRRRGMQDKRFALLTLFFRGVEYEYDPDGTQRIPNARAEAYEAALEEVLKTELEKEIPIWQAQFEPVLEKIIRDLERSPELMLSDEGKMSIWEAYLRERMRFAWQKLLQKEDSFKWLHEGPGYLHFLGRILPPQAKDLIQRFEERLSEHYRLIIQKNVGRIASEYDRYRMIRRPNPENGWVPAVGFISTPSDPDMYYGAMTTFVDIKGREKQDGDFALSIPPTIGEAFNRGWFVSFKIKMRANAKQGDGEDIFVFDGWRGDTSKILNSERVLAELEIIIRASLREANNKMLRPELRTSVEEAIEGAIQAAKPLIMQLEGAVRDYEDALAKYQNLLDRLKGHEDDGGFKIEALEEFEKSLSGDQKELLFNKKDPNPQEMLIQIDLMIADVLIRLAKGAITRLQILESISGKTLIEQADILRKNNPWRDKWKLEKIFPPEKRRLAKAFYEALSKIPPQIIPVLKEPLWASDYAVYDRIADEATRITRNIPDIAERVKARNDEMGMQMFFHWIKHVYTEERKKFPGSVFGLTIDAGKSQTDAIVSITRWNRTNIKSMEGLESFAMPINGNEAFVKKMRDLGIKQISLDSTAFSVLANPIMRPLEILLRGFLKLPGARAQLEEFVSEDGRLKNPLFESWDFEVTRNKDGSLKLSVNADRSELRRKTIAQTVINIAPKELRTTLRVLGVEAIEDANLGQYLLELALSTENLRSELIEEAEKLMDRMETPFGDDPVLSQLIQSRDQKLLKLISSTNLSSQPVTLGLRMPSKNNASFIARLFKNLESRGQKINLLTEKGSTFELNRNHSTLITPRILDEEDWNRGIEIPGNAQADVLVASEVSSQSNPMAQMFNGFALDISGADENILIQDHTELLFMTLFILGNEILADPAQSQKFKGKTPAQKGALLEAALIQKLQEAGIDYGSNLFGMIGLGGNGYLTLKGSIVAQALVDMSAREKMAQAA